MKNIAFKREWVAHSRQYAGIWYHPQADRYSVARLPRQSFPTLADAVSARDELTKGAA